jgi:hypothetical protein
MAMFLRSLAASHVPMPARPVAPSFYSEFFSFLLSVGGNILNKRHKPNAARLSRFVCPADTLTASHAGGIVAITFLCTGFLICCMLCYFEVYVPWDQRRKGMTSISAANLAVASSKDSEKELFVEMKGSNAASPEDRA